MSRNGEKYIQIDINVNKYLTKYDFYLNFVG